MITWPIFGRPLKRSFGSNSDGGEHITSISSRISATQAASLIAYWQLAETSGTTIVDSSPTGAGGAYSGSVSLNQSGAGDGSPSVLFSGGFGNLTAGLTALNAAFVNTVGTLFAWCKITNSGIWTDGLVHVVAELGADVNNRVLVFKDTTNGRVTFNHISGGTTKSVNFASSSPLTFFSVGITWDKVADQVKAYFNGAQVGTTQTGLGVWVGSLAAAWTAIANERSTVALDVWSGNLAHVAAWKIALTATEIARIGVLGAS